MSAQLRSSRCAVRFRLTAVALLALALPGIAAPSASAVPGQIELKTAFAGPISGDEPRCTPEPGGRLAYGTQVPFDPSKPITSPTGIGKGYPGSSDYVPANMPSTDSITPALQAGTSSDLCLGFTLTPNMESGFVRTAENSSGRRYQETPPLPDIDETHVLDGTAGDDIKDIVIDMPAGFAGDPAGATACTAQQFGIGNFLAAACPAAAQVGTVYSRLSTLLYSIKQHLALGGLPNQSGGFEGGQVFNLEHGPNELARLGVEIAPVDGLAPAKFTVRLTFAPDGSGRIRAVTKNAPRQLYFIDDIVDGQPRPGAPISQLYVESIGIRAWGKKADHPTLARDFAEWGTNCSDPISSDIDVTTYAGTRSTMTSPAVTLTGCDQLPFDPSVSVETTERRPGVPTGATIKVQVPQTGAVLKSALLRDAAVTLPAGLELGAQAGSRVGGLELCQASEFDVDAALTPNGCPAGSRAGDVKITTPLLAEPFTGSLYLGQQLKVGDLPRLYLEAAQPGATADDAPRIKLVGTVSTDDNGQLTTVFKDAPQLRFSELEISFPGGPDALFTTPRSCGTTTGTSQLTSWASSTPKTVESSLTIDQDCALPGFAPQFAMTADDPTSGALSPTTVSITRTDRSAWIRDVRVSLPAGFLANLNAAVECGGIEASRAICPAESRIGLVRTVAGAGDAPLALDGAMYLTAPDPGAVAGANIVVRAKIGELDLGTVNVRARIDLRPTDAGLVLSTAVPLRFRGLALNLREITVRLDRPGFALNPTACGPLAAAGEFVGDGGQPASRITAVGYYGCAARPFQPGFAAFLRGDTKPGGHPEVRVTMTPRLGDSNLRSATVTLPAGISTDLKNLQVTCPQDAFAAGACPAATRVGFARAAVSITSEVIPGDVYLVKVDGQTLPGLGMSFTGRYSQRVLSTVKINSEGRVVTDFAAIPDLPLTRLDLVIDGGEKSPIQLSPKACTENGEWEGVLTGQGGQATQVTDTLPCDAAAVEDIKPTMDRKKGLSLTVDAIDGERIRYAKVTVGSSFRLRDSSTLKRYLFSEATGGDIFEKRRSSKSFFVMRDGKAGTGPNKIEMRLSLKALRVPKRYREDGLPKGAKIQVRVRTVLEKNKVSTQTVTVKAE